MVSVILQRVNFTHHVDRRSVAETDGEASAPPAEVVKIPEDEPVLYEEIQYNGKLNHRHVRLALEYIYERRSMHVHSVFFGLI